MIYPSDFPLQPLAADVSKPVRLSLRIAGVVPDGASSAVPFSVKNPVPDVPCNAWKTDKRKIQPPQTFRLYLMSPLMSYCVL